MTSKNYFSIQVNFLSIVCLENAIWAKYPTLHSGEKFQTLPFPPHNLLKPILQVFCQSDISTLSKINAKSRISHFPSGSLAYWLISMLSKFDNFQGFSPWKRRWEFWSSRFIMWRKWKPFWKARRLYVAECTAVRLCTVKKISILISIFIVSTAIEC